MTSIEGALAVGDLPEYNGRPVIRTAIKVTNAGDGLSQGLAIDPNVLDIGSTVYIVLECVVDSHEHDRILDKKSDTGLMILNQVLKAGTGTLIDADVVKDAIAEQAEKIELAREAANGTQRLPFDEELEEMHNAGAHAGGLVTGCSACEWEISAKKVEDDEAAAKSAAEAAFDAGLAALNEAEAAVEPDAEVDA